MMRRHGNEGREEVTQHDREKKKPKKTKVREEDEAAK